MNSCAYHPHTVLAGGITHLGAAMPAATSKSKAKPTKPHKTMPNPAKPGRPAKPATVKTLPKDEDYSTPYVPPVAPPVVNQPLTTAQPASMPELDDIVIEDNVPLPVYKNTKVELCQALLTRLQPGQSAKLALHMRCSLTKVVSAAHKASQGKFVTRPKFDNDKTLRVWRVA